MQIVHHRHVDDGEPAAEAANIVETTDAPANTGTGYTIDVGDSFSGTLSPRGDRDWVAVELEAGHTYEIALTGSPSGHGTLSDPYLRVYDANGNLVTENDDGGTGYESLATVTISVTGTYYVSAGSYRDGYTGTYRIAVSEGDPVELADLDTLAGYLTDGYWQENGASRRAFNTTTDNIITVNITGLTPEGQELARQALAAWEMVADIRFQEVTGSADITFDDNDSGAYSTSVVSGGRILSSRVNVSQSWIDTYGPTVDSYAYQAYVHEIGHALGLGHQGDYNGNAIYGQDAVFANDSWQISIMSYFSQTENPTTTASYAFLGTAMMADIVAIQTLYGAPGAGSATAGDTVYGANNTLGGHLGTVFAAIAGASVPASLIAGNGLAATIYDTGGTDTIDLSASPADNRLDLRPEQFSDIGGLIGNLGIARGTIIENAAMGDGDDHVTGNAADNRLLGRGGEDTLLGGDGDDLIKGGGADDLIEGGAGNDTLRGQNGVDEIHGGDGNDSLAGNNGEDTMHGDGGNDSLKGGHNWDTLDGGTGEDTVIGQNGHDTVSGGAGDDVVRGNNGRDLLDGDAGNDLLDGGYGNDRMRGGSGRDTLIGGSGRDTLLGQGGDDELTGGNGPDIFVFDYGSDTGDDTITDFEDGIDVIQIRGSATFDDLTISQTGPDTLVTWADGSVVIENAVGVIGEDDFVFA
ncbi:MAG: M10 family metallopeptidase [Roseovarius sp.]